MIDINGLLPIGSVIKIKDYKQPVMIIKINTTNEADYYGVEHPIGYDNSEKIIKFMMNDIEKVFFIGRIDKKVEIDLVKKTIKKKIGKEQ
jgi:hypothetical protein